MCAGAADVLFHGNSLSPSRHELGVNPLFPTRRRFFLNLKKKEDDDPFFFKLGTRGTFLSTGVAFPEHLGEWILSLSHG